MKSFNLPSLPVKSTLIVAVSGGPDSVALLSLLLQTKRYNLIVAHFNHSLRGKDSDRDEVFVKSLAGKYKLPFVSHKLAVLSYAKQHKFNLEASAREQRYLFLEEARKKFKADLIVTGHTADDQAETILFNFLRGSGLDGLSGMETLNRKLWRPLLSVTKSELLAYLKQHKLKFRLDRSNQSLEFSRNRLRLKVLPELEKVNPEFQTVLLRNAYLYREFSNFLKHLAADFLKLHFKQASFSLKAFRKLPRLLQFEVLRSLQSHFAGFSRDLSLKRLEMACDLLQTGRSGKHFRFSPQLTFSLTYARVTCAAGAQPLTANLAPCPFKVPGKTVFLGQELHSKFVTKFQTGTKREVCLDYDKTGSLFLRNFKAGDRFQPSGMQGTRKLQDFFTDQKITRTERTRIPLLVTARDEIACIVGYRVSEKFKASLTSTHILKIKLKTISHAQQ